MVRKTLKHWRKDLEKTLEGKTSHTQELEELVVWKRLLPKAIHRFRDPVKIPMPFFTEMETCLSTYMGVHKTPQRQNKQTEGLALKLSHTWFLQSHSKRTVDLLCLSPASQGPCDFSQPPVACEFPPSRLRASHTSARLVLVTLGGDWLRCWSPLWKPRLGKKHNYWVSGVSPWAHVLRAAFSAAVLRHRAIKREWAHEAMALTWINEGLSRAFAIKGWVISLPPTRSFSLLFIPPFILGQCSNRALTTCQHFYIRFLSLQSCEK